MRNQQIERARDDEMPLRIALHACVRLYTVRLRTKRKSVVVFGNSITQGHKKWIETSGPARLFWLRGRRVFWEVG